MEVSQQIIQVLDSMSDKFGLAIDWSQNNILPYIQQLGEKVVSYEIGTSIVWIIIGAIIIISSIITLKLGLKWLKNEDDEFAGMLSIAFSAIFIIIFTVVVLSQVFDIVTCYTFPEKVWINYIKETITSINQ